MMPYILQERRDELDPLILPLTMFPAEDPKTDGEIAYVVMKIIDGVYSGKSYGVYMRGIGNLICGVFEWYRKRVASYEDKKCDENGEVFE